MMAERIAADVPRDRIDPSARIEGQSYVCGGLTRIGPGAVVKDSYIHNVIVEEGAQVIDAVLDASEQRRPPRFPADFATDLEALWPPGNPDVLCRIGPHAQVEGCSLGNTSVGARSTITRSAIYETKIGEHCVIDLTSASTMFFGAHTTMRGPIEIGYAWVGHHAFVDRNACLGGIFSNDLAVIEFDSRSGGLSVKEVIDIPHAGRYGMNVICCSYSGFVPAQPGNSFSTFGLRDAAKWPDLLPAYGQDRFDPCCWVGGWTQAIATPRQTVFRTYEDLLTEGASVHLMPFSVAGYGASTVSERTMPGELHRGSVYKQRVHAWPFTYAPGAVFEMVKRVHAVTGKEIADRIVDLTLKNALALTEHMARQRGIDLDATTDSSKGWAGWLHQGKKTIQSHLQSGLWEFSDGEPVNWHSRDGKWTPRNPDRLLRIAPDALDNQRTEEGLLRCEQPALARELGPNPEELRQTLSDTLISPESRVSERAFIGPGVQVQGKSVIEDGAWLYRSVVKDSVVGKNSRVLRSFLDGSRVGEDSRMMSTSLVRTTYAGKAEADSARAHDCSFGDVRMGPLASAVDCAIPTGCILGINAKNVLGETYSWLAHPLGIAENLRVVPSVIAIDGRRIELRGTPCFGGGSRMLGTPDAPVTVECAFVSSNSILRAGAYVSYGCFVMKGLDYGEGLLPFTLKTGPGPENDQPAAVLFQFPQMVFGAFIHPTFHGTAPENLPYVRYCVTARAQEAAAAVEWALGLRKEGRPWDPSSPFARYANLRHYSEDQLSTGLRGYRAALADGRWDMEYVDGELRFCGRGEWVIENFRARWKPR